MYDFLKNHLAFRYIGCVVIILFIFFTGFGIYLHKTQEQRELENNTAISKASLENISLALRDWIEFQVNLVSIIAKSEEVISACKNPTDQFIVARAQQYLQTIHDTYGFYENIPLAAHIPGGGSFDLEVGGQTRTIKDGTFFTDTVNGNTLGRGGTQMSFIQATRQGQEYFISEVYPSLLRGNPIFVIAAPVVDNGKYVGTAILAPQMDYFTDIFISKTGIGETGHLFFIDDRGQFIAHQDQQMILNQDARTKAGFVDRILKGEYDFLSDQGTDQTYRYLSLDIDIPQEHIKHGWTLIASQALEEIMSHADESRKKLFYAGIFLLLTLTALLYFLTDILVTRPLSKVVGHAREIEQGNLNAQMDLQRSDEIGLLADNLKKMTARIMEKMQEAEEQTNLAKQESERARVATDQARQAKDQAEKAKREGMLDAASQLEEIVSRVSSASEELSAQVEQSSRGAEEQKSRTTETATAMEQMNATILEVAQSSSSAASGADKARDEAKEGARIVDDSIKSIARVQEMSRSVKNSLDELGSQATQIDRIMDVIEDIADQTNLLALNAAIEAARAGDAGRGFAVVADEVRKLAEKTMNATQEVDQVIASIQNGAKANIDGMDRAVAAVDEAISLADNSGDALKKIVELVEDVADQVRNIATATEEQSSASEEVNRSIEDINRIAAETADVMEQSSKAISELAQQAGELQNLIQELKNTR
ncbi:methyl-accepting chemotaxis protein [Desulfonatronovibrio hydrogenovorans]|uniref:methyl-accepting chemotaxis protein n=1 Tax=Desulfonatronovibrio hydrogenovorans TaxID=53245 RepID=UPI00068DEF9B|nr:methyl-accepting chemotaxis protein [Desulfonatronovibrio hydrogenovorans]